MKKLIFGALIGLIAYWGYNNQVHTDLMALYEHWDDEQVRYNTLNRIESKLTRVYLNRPYKLSVDKETNEAELIKNQSVDAFATELVKDCKTKREKAKAIYKYMTHNIVYDDNYKIYDADQCFIQKKGVCQAYSELFVKMTTAVGVNSIVVSGHSKRLTHKEGLGLHAWVLIEDDNGKYYPADPCWDAVDKDEHGKVIRKAGWDWFDIDPELLIFTHHPFLEWQQLLDKKVSLNLFERLPYIDSDDTKCGLNYKELLSKARKGESIQIPQIFNSDIEYTILQIPYSDKLKKGQSYKFSIQTKHPMKMAVFMNEKLLTQPTASQRKHHLTFTPSKSGKITLGFAKDNLYYHTIGYIVE